MSLGIKLSRASFDDKLIDCIYTMPPRIPQIAIGWSNLPRSCIKTRDSSVCLFCTHALSRTKILSKQRRSYEPRRALTATSTSNIDNVAPTTRISARKELQESLRELQKRARRFVNLSRVELALHGLQQDPGNEAIRIAVLGLADGGKSLQSARKLLRLLLADPLKPEEDWERILLDGEQAGKPLLLRVGHGNADQSGSGGWLVREIRVSSPALNGHNLELLILEVDPSEEMDADAFSENILVPSMEIPTSNTGRFTPITTPVHKALIVGEGLMGAASLANFPSRLDRNLIGLTANVQLLKNDPSVQLQIVNIEEGTDALRLFRDNLEKGLEYEKQWFASGIQDLVDWIKLETDPTQAEMKEPLRKLILSVLERSGRAIQAEESLRLAASLSSKVKATQLTPLLDSLDAWAENAHTELRDRLETAFGSQRWSKLSWWKLFWRVDDVSMIANDILSKNFLTSADEEVIFLAGVIAHTQVAKGVSYDTPTEALKPTSSPDTIYAIGSEPPPPDLHHLIAPQDRALATEVVRPWPTHIGLTRSYLSRDTVPALQALSQKLVLQTLTTSSFASIAAGLMYVSTISTSFYEAGAVAALGVVWGMRRMQGKWETARKFWEGEVREEGRKAINGVERTFRDVLTVKDEKVVEVDEELELAKTAVRKAEEAFEKCQ